jgi:spore coat polysaccharide biosynthesis protein SpsF
MTTAIIVQARMTSTRLPGKILADLAGRPMLAQELLRLRRCRLADEIVVATTTNASDDPVIELCRQLDVRCYRGDEHDVLSRYLGAMREAQADLVVRVTADCPLIDPDEVDRVIAGASDVDYCANVLARTFPRGLDAEALWSDVLARVARLARSREAREHVTWFIRQERPELFAVRSIVGETDDSDLRWTVDEPEDLDLVRKIYAAAELDRRHVPYRELVQLVRTDPALQTINAHVQQVRG